MWVRWRKLSVWILIFICCKPESETAYFNHVCLQLFRILLDLVGTTPSWSFLHSSLEHLASVHFFPCIKAPSIQLVCISRRGSVLLCRDMLKCLLKEASPSFNSGIPGYCSCVVIILSRTTALRFMDR